MLLKHKFKIIKHCGTVKLSPSIKHFRLNRIFVDIIVVYLKNRVFNDLAFACLSSELCKVCSSILKKFRISVQKLWAKYSVLR